MSSILAKRDTQIDFRVIESPKLSGPPLVNRPRVEESFFRYIRKAPFIGKTDSAANYYYVDSISGLRKYTLVEAVKLNIRLY